MLVHLRPRRCLDGATFNCLLNNGDWGVYLPLGGNEMWHLNKLSMPTLFGLPFVVAGSDLALLPGELTRKR